MSRVGQAPSLSRKSAAHSLTGLGRGLDGCLRGLGRMEISASVLGTTCLHSPGSAVSYTRVRTGPRGVHLRGRGSFCRKQLPLLLSPQGLGAVVQAQLDSTERTWSMCAFVQIHTGAGAGRPSLMRGPPEKPYENLGLGRGRQAQHFWGWFPLEMPGRDAAGSLSLLKSFFGHTALASNCSPGKGKAQVRAAGHPASALGSLPCVCACGVHSRPF